MGLCGDGAMAEWLGSGLQIHVRRFDSGSHLHNLVSKRDLTNPVYVCILGMLTAARINLNNPLESMGYRVRFCLTNPDPYGTIGYDEK